MYTQTCLHPAMDFDWDVGNRAKCLKHGLSIEEIEHALAHGAQVLPDLDHSETEERFVAVSRTAQGRPVFISFCRRGERMRPISARYMHAREVARYDRATQDRSPHDH